MRKTNIGIERRSWGTSDISASQNEERDERQSKQIKYQRTFSFNRRTLQVESESEYGREREVADGAQTWNLRFKNSENIEKEGRSDMRFGHADQLRVAIINTRLNQVCNPRSEVDTEPVKAIVNRPS